MSHGRLDALTGLRGVAALSVLLGHGLHWCYSSGGYHLSALIAAIGTELAYFGISLFFVLSGFVIQHTYAHRFRDTGFRSAAAAFFVSRFARLYPLYLVALVLSLGTVAMPTGAGGAEILAAHLTLTRSWFNLQEAVFAPAWSISTEWFFYIVFALFVMPIAAATRRPQVITAALAGTTLVASWLVWLPHRPAPQAASSKPSSNAPRTPRPNHVLLRHLASFVACSSFMPPALVLLH